MANFWSSEQHSLAGTTTSPVPHENVWMGSRKCVRNLSPMGREPRSAKACAQP